MSRVEIVSGELELGHWQVFNNRLEKSNFTTVHTLAFSDVTSITKKEEVAGYVYIDIISVSGKLTLAKAKLKSYMCLYEYWSIHRGGEKPNVELEGIRQLKAAALWASNKPSGVESGENKVSNTAVQKSKPYTIVVAAFLLIWFVSDTSEADVDGVIDLAPQQKEKLCKQYIGSIMGRAPNVMYKYKTGDKYTSYIKYQREDGEYWSYACSFTKDSIVWAGWLSDYSKWGRVMYEDEAKLVYNKTNSIVTIKGHGGISW